MSQPPNSRTEAIAAFYRDHRLHLLHTVTPLVGGSDPATIEDACQTAWTILARRDDVALDGRGFSWLVTVAIREGWRTARPADVPVGCFIPAVPTEGYDDGLLAEPAGEHPDPADVALEREQHIDRVRALEQLKPAERQALTLKALGYSYGEIAQLTAASYTAVNRRLAEGRASLRRLEAARRAAQDA